MVAKVLSCWYGDSSAFYGVAKVLEGLYFGIPGGCLAVTIIFKAVATVLVAGFYGMLGSC